MKVHISTIRPPTITNLSDLESMSWAYSKTDNITALIKQFDFTDF